MKDVSRANRGKPFEDLLKMVHSKYRQTGLACVHKVPTEFIPIRNAAGKVVNCKVEEKSCVDYLGRYRNIAVAVEAKHTDENRIRFDRVEDHQAEYLDDFCRDPGAVGIVIVSFQMRRFFAVPWPFWKEAREAWAAGAAARTWASVPVKAYGDFWDTPAGASVAPDQLLPEWEIKTGGPYILPYLKIIEYLAWKEKQPHGA